MRTLAKRNLFEKTKTKENLQARVQNLFARRLLLEDIRWKVSIT